MKRDVGLIADSRGSFREPNTAAVIDSGGTECSNRRLHVWSPEEDRDDTTRELRERREVELNSKYEERDNRHGTHTRMRTHAMRGWEHVPQSRDFQHLDRTRTESYV